MSHSAAALDSVFDAYRSAVYDKNVDAFVRLYADDVRIFDAWAEWSHDGAAAWRPAVEGWFASLGSGRVRVRFDEVHILGGGELLHASAIVTYAAISASGEAIRAMQNRLTWLLRAGPPARIVHEHTSAPIGLGDMKAMLHREQRQ
ncbi:MAG: nuclear transport factor 2 family protein [Rudaea sp.]